MRYDPALVVALVLALLPLTAGAQSDPEGVFMSAEGLLRSGQTEQARAAYERILAEVPRDAETATWRSAALVRLGDLAWRAGAWQAAGAHYVDVLESEAASSWTSRARLKLALVTLAERDWPGGIDLLQRVLSATGPESDKGAAESATRALTLVSRVYLRPAAGESAYVRSRLMQIGAPLDRPVALAVSSDGEILVVDEGAPAVLLKNPERDAASQLQYNAHTRPWWGLDGLPYLPTRKAGVIALGGSRVGFLASDTGRPQPLKELEAGTRRPDGSWYLVDGDPRRVLRFAPDGSFLGRVTTPAEEPVDVAVDHIGRLYVLDRLQPGVIRFDASGERDRVVASSPWRRPEALAVDWMGNVYVLDRDARTIDIFSPEGNRLLRLGPVLPGGIELRGPRDIAVDGAGRIFVADRSERSVVVIE